MPGNIKRRRRKEKERETERRQSRDVMFYLTDVKKMAQRVLGGRWLSGQPQLTAPVLPAFLLRPRVCVRGCGYVCARTQVRGSWGGACVRAHR